MNVEATAEDTAEDEGIVEEGLEGDDNGVVEVTAKDTAEDEGTVEGDVNGVVETAAEDAARDTGIVATIVVGVLVNAVLGCLVVSAALAVPAAAGVVVTGALESALVENWLVAPILLAGGGLVVGVVVGG
jgi:hypothetical protein